MCINEQFLLSEAREQTYKHRNIQLRRTYSMNGEERKRERQLNCFEKMRKATNV
jgi:hypothetical protein